MDSAKTKIILGPPGTGKTTRLLELLDYYLSKGISPRQIGFTSFAKKTIEEARTRALGKFVIDEMDLVYFRTIHSLCFRQLGVSSEMVMRTKQYSELMKLIGIHYSESEVIEEDDDLGELAFRGNRYIFLESLARARCKDNRSAWREDDKNLDWYEYDLFCRTLKQYKQQNLLMDYTDLLERYLIEGKAPYFKALFVDEAQDLSTLQWKVVEKLASNAEVVYIAGDDDQAVFKWNGADVDKFISLKGEERTLNKSYRLPPDVYNIATKAVGRIRHRKEKIWSPNDSEGEVKFHHYIQNAPLHEGNWLILARNKYLYKEAENLCLEKGYSYEIARGRKSIVQDKLMDAILKWEHMRKGNEISFEDARLVYGFMSSAKGGNLAKGAKDLLDKTNREQGFTIGLLQSQCGLLKDGPWFETMDKIPAASIGYIKECRRRNESLSNPRIKLSTIHASKGGECDNVLLITDMSKRTYVDYNDDPDNEIRVFYVGMTRAKKNLHILNPQTDKFFYV